MGLNAGLDLAIDCRADPGQAEEVG
jgi:hypothetical protein